MTKYEVANNAQSTANSIKVALADQADKIMLLQHKLAVAERQLSTTTVSQSIVSTGVVDLNDPVTYILLFALVGIIGITMKIVWSRIKKNEDELKEEKEKNYESLKILEDKICGASVHKNDCDAKQTLWSERFDNMLRQHERDHSQILEAMKKEARASASRTADFAEQLKELSECVKKLELGKEC